MEREEKVGNITLNYEYYSGQDLYCDGEVEDELLDIVKEYDESKFHKIIAEKNQWPVLYHLSSTRGNIIEWMPMEADAKVLEVGAGCGAVTGTLAAKAGKVDCIELSRKRSLINAYRNRSYSNIRIYVGNFETIEKALTEQYDYITLIGVLEYAESYILAEQPYVEFLRLMKKHLNPNGKLIIAIENKYGLKYWAGCREDHVSKYFEGIEGYQDSHGVKTFSKRELENLFRESGYTAWEFYYPYPDYKLPCAIYSDQYLPKPGELSNNMRNFDGERLVLFDEGKVFDGLIEEGVFPFYANSYLVILGRGEN